MHIWLGNLDNETRLKTLLRMREIVQEGSGVLGHRATAHQIDCYEDYLITAKEIGEIDSASSLMIKAINEEIAELQEEEVQSYRQDEEESDGSCD